jgi:hypothetical protein
MSLELEIGELRLTFEGVAGRPDRATNIGRRALGTLEELVRQNLAQLELAGPGRRLARVNVPAVRADLRITSDEQVARLVGQAMYEALIEQLRV